ncbi:MAG: type II toxin-antitoxin system MqsA family antitoxin [Deltaproteobacteria bacterium]|nr:type II toxin-antitoxin system MqsA family antitoxin [Deltaproteobacteria bacterium]
MKCRVCGSTLQSIRTDLPFKVDDRSIVIFKELPVLQCQNCAEYLIEDPVMGRVEELLSTVDRGAELEIIRFAA